MYFAAPHSADNSVPNVIDTFPGVFRTPLRHVHTSTVMHQMNQLSVWSGRPNVRRGARPIAPLPRRGTDAHKRPLDDKRRRTALLGAIEGHAYSHRRTASTTLCSSPNDSFLSAQVGSRCLVDDWVHARSWRSCPLHRWLMDDAATAELPARPSLAAGRDACRAPAVQHVSRWTYHLDVS
jgi:hypothetical protein